MRILKILIIITTSLLVGACATLTVGNEQLLTVQTSPESNAQCSLNNNEGAWYISQTPSYVTIRRSSSALKIACTAKNNASAAAVINPFIHERVLYGGLIGAVIDRDNGSAYEYPQVITVEIKAKLANKTHAKNKCCSCEVKPISENGDKASVYNNIPVIANSNLPNQNPSGAVSSYKQHKDQKIASAPVCAENGSCYGDTSKITHRPKTVHVRGYYRKNGTYVRGHYRSK